MTTDAYGGYQPPTESPTTHPGNDQGSTTQAAKEQAGNVASTASDQAKNVAGEAKHQAQNLMNQTQSQVREQAGAQKDKAAGGLRSLADELRSMVDGTSTGPQSGMASDLARQASDKAQDLAGWLESREPGDLLEELRGLARRKPGTFLLGAAVAGVLAGRATRSAVDVKRDDNGADRTAGTGYADTNATPPGAEWASATGSGSVPPGGVVVEEEITVVAAEPYATTSGGRTGSDRL